MGAFDSASLLPFFFLSPTFFLVSSYLLSIVMATTPENFGSDFDEDVVRQLIAIEIRNTPKRKRKPCSSPVPVRKVRRPRQPRKPRKSPLDLDSDYSYNGNNERTRRYFRTLSKRRRRRAVRSPVPEHLLDRNQRSPSPVKKAKEFWLVRRAPSPSMPSRIGPAKLYSKDRTPSPVPRKRRRDELCNMCSGQHTRADCPRAPSDWEDSDEFFEDEYFQDDPDALEVLRSQSLPDHAEPPPRDYVDMGKLFGFMRS